MPISFDWLHVQGSRAPVTECCACIACRSVFGLVKYPPVQGAQYTYSSTLRGSLTKFKSTQEWEVVLEACTLRRRWGSPLGMSSCSIRRRLGGQLSCRGCTGWEERDGCFWADLLFFWPALLSFTLCQHPLQLHALPLQTTLPFKSAAVLESCANRPN